MISEKTVLQQNPEIPATEIDGEIVLMSSQTGRYYSLANSAASIWKVLGSATTIEGICASVSAQYTVDEEMCRREVTEFIETLVEHKLIRAAEA